MNGIILRWGVPALLTVVGGTFAAVLSTGAAMTADLTARSVSATAADFPWADIRFDGRDAVLSGTATDAGTIAAATSRLSELHGVRSVSSDDVILAEFVSPFPFAATVSNGQVSLSGGVPDETAHAEILLASGGAEDKLRLMSGVPDRTKWRSATSYALELAQQFDAGEIEVADLAVQVSGRARSARAFDAAQKLLASPPAGVELKSAAVTPALASPYDWIATFDGNRLEISGYKPDESFVDRLKIADIAGRPVSTSMLLASGAPAGFEDNAVLLLQNLMQLEYGEARISDADLSLVGAPADAAIAESVRLAMTPSGAAVSLEPPKINEFILEAAIVGGKIKLDGFLPDQSTLDRLAGDKDVDATGVELARGAPERFQSGLDFAIDALRLMSEGSVRLEGTSISLSGRASTLRDFHELQTTLNLGAPQGLILRHADVLPPMASPFTWTAVKTSGNTINLSGYVPDEAAQVAQHEAAPIGADTASIADGEPDDFVRLSVAALDVLELLDTGKVVYDGSVWSISGAVDSAQKGFAAQSAFTAAGLHAAGWSYSVDLPKPAATAALPVIEPYTWRAQKAADGTVTFAGFLPTDILKRFLANRVGAKLKDNSALGAGAPEGFIGEALAGLDALLGLQEGALSFAGDSWTLSGLTATGAERARIQDALVAAVDEDKWQITVQAKDAAPVVSPFTWSAVKGDNGRISLSGYVTTDELRRFVTVRAGDVVSDTTELASGEPAGFMADVLAGLEAIGHLRSGSVTFDGTTFSLTGVPATTADRDAALAALSSATDGGSAWSKDLATPVAPVAEPEPPPVELLPEPAAIEPEPEPVAEPVPETAMQPVEPAAPATADQPAARDTVFSATKLRGAPIELSGKVPADAARRYFGVIAGGVPTDGMTVSSDLPAGFINGAIAGIRTLDLLELGTLAFDGASWAISGEATNDEKRTAALSELSSEPATGDWQTSITLLPQIELCRDTVAALAARNAILFQSGSARITDDSAPALDELAADLMACPNATVHVEGHTDSDGDEALNLALSVSRAEAVVEALIARGVGYERLYAIGYGESLPVESNDTRAGKQANRRIAFTILDQDE